MPSQRRARRLCPHCGDVVGVYEPVVWVTEPGDGDPRPWHERCHGEAATRRERGEEGVSGR